MSELIEKAERIVQQMRQDAAAMVQTLEMVGFFDWEQERNPQPDLQYTMDVHIGNPVNISLQIPQKDFVNLLASGRRDRNLALINWVKRYRKAGLVHFEIDPPLPEYYQMESTTHVLATRLHDEAAMIERVIRDIGEANRARDVSVGMNGGQVTVFLVAQNFQFQVPTSFVSRYISAEIKNREGYLAELVDEYAYILDATA